MCRAVCALSQPVHIRCSVPLVCLFFLCSCTGLPAMQSVFASQTAGYVKCSCGVEYRPRISPTHMLEVDMRHLPEALTC